MPAEHLPMLDQIREEFLCLAKHPQNIGSLDNPSGKGTTTGQCGDSIEVFLRIRGGSIADIKVLPHGCIYTLVCASAMSELAKGRDLDRALELEPQEVASVLGGLPEEHMHCARLAVNTLGEAVADYYRKVLNAVSNDPA